MLYFIQILIIIHKITAISWMNCTENSIKFEKIIGIKPIIINTQILYKNVQNQPITIKCIDRCRSDNTCASFIIDYAQTICYKFNVIPTNGLPSTNIGWFIKTCNSDVNCKNEWIYERIVGTTLIGNNTKNLGKITRDECKNYCKNNHEFECKSMKFRKISHNLGECILSQTNRQISPIEFRVSTYDDEYIENMCVIHKNKSEKLFCAYEEYINMTLIHTDLSYENRTKDECEWLCENEFRFICRGYTIINTVNLNAFLCNLHSEDTKIHGPHILEPKLNARYYEKVKCINISIVCTENDMTINYQPDRPFYGRLYMEGYLNRNECSINGDGFNLLTLNFPLKKPPCGIITAIGSNDKSLLTGTLIIQYNSMIQTRNDRFIRIGCIFGDDNRLLVGTGLSVDNHPNKGSAILNGTDKMKPIINLRVIDFGTKNESQNIEIGQELLMIIDWSNWDTSQDFTANHLIAMTENGDDSLELIDIHGCPTNPRIFSRFEKIRTNQIIRLSSNFQAFRFTNSPIVRFSVMIEFCDVNCPENECLDNGRGKRASRLIETVPETRIVQLERGQSDLMRLPLELVLVVRDPKILSDKFILGDNKILIAGYDYITNEVCLDFSLFIGLVLTWIIIQIIFLISCIIIIKRYRKHYEEEFVRQSLDRLHNNFGYGCSNLDNRRVRWADDNAQDYT